MAQTIISSDKMFEYRQVFGKYLNLVSLNKNKLSGYFIPSLQDSHDFDLLTSLKRKKVFKINWQIDKENDLSHSLIN